MVIPGFPTDLLPAYLPVTKYSAHHAPLSILDYHYPAIRAMHLPRNIRNEVHREQCGQLTEECVEGDAYHWLSASLDSLSLTAGPGEELSKTMSSKKKIMNLKLRIVHCQL